MTDTVPAVDGWFEGDGQPHLVGLQCPVCNTRVFPPRAVACPNPDCAGEDLREVALARTGTVWSWATNHYPPPEPYVAADPYEPVTVVAVELDDEELVVLGQLDGDPDRLAVGAEMELTVGTLFEDEDGRRTVWMWRRTA